MTDKWTASDTDLVESSPVSALQLTGTPSAAITGTITVSMHSVAPAQADIPTTHYRRVDTYEVTARCPRKCGGSMHATGRGVTRLDTVWAHKCDECSAIEWYSETYPHIEHQERRK